MSSVEKELQQRQDLGRTQATQTLAVNTITENKSLPDLIIVNKSAVFLPQRPSLVTVVEWIDYETLALLFGMVRLLRCFLCLHLLSTSYFGQSSCCDN